MKFQHVFRNMLPTNTLKDFLEPRLSKYEDFVAANTKVKATYQVVHNDFIVKLTLIARNRAEVVAIEKDTNVFVALDKAIGKIERQLRKQKEKRAQRQRPLPKDLMFDYNQAAGF